MAEPIRLWKKETIVETKPPEPKGDLPLPVVPEKGEPIRLWKKVIEEIPRVETPIMPSPTERYIERLELPKAELGAAPPEEIKPPEVPKLPTPFVKKEALPLFMEKKVEPIKEPKPEIEPKKIPLWKKATAAFTAGVGDVLSTTGAVLDLVGAERLGEKTKGLGENLRTRYIPPQKPEEFSWKSPLNPEWWATTVTRTVPFTLSLIPAAVVGAYGGVKAAAVMKLGSFGKTVLGSLGGAALSRPIESALEAGNTYDEQIKVGRAKEEAEKAANKVFWDNMKLVGLDAAQFIAAFAPIKGIGLTAKGAIARRMLSVGKVGARIGVVGATEAGEEGYQDIIQRRAIGEKVVLDPRMSEAMAIGAIFGAGLGTAGSVWDALTTKIKRELPAETIREIEEVKAQEIKKGVPEQLAEAKAFDKIAETSEGKMAVERAIEDLKTKVKEIEPKVEPTPPEVEVKPPVAEVKPKIIKAYRGVRKYGEKGLPTEGEGLYITPDIEFARGFGRIYRIDYIEPKKLFIVKNDYLPLFDELFEVEAPIKPTDSKWIKLNKRIIQKTIIPKYGKEWWKKDEAIKEAGKLITQTLQREGYEGIKIINPKFTGIPTAEKLTYDILFEPQKYIIKTKLPLPKEVKPEVKPIKLIREIEIPPRPITRKAEIVKLLSKQKKDIISTLRQKQKEIKGVKQQIVDYVKVLIPLPRRGMYLDAIKRVETQRDLIETFTRVDKEAKKIEIKKLAKELRDELRKISESKSIAIDYKKRIRELVEPIEIPGHIQKTIAKLKATEGYINRQKTLGKDVFMPEQVLESLKILRRKPITEMSSSEIQLIIDKIKDLEVLGKTKLRTIRELYELQKERILDDIVKNKDVKSVEKQPIFRPPVGTKITLWQSFHNKFNGVLNHAQHVDLSLTPMDVWFDILDGSSGTYEGILYRIFKKTIDTDWGNYLELKDKFTEPLWKIHDKHRLSQESRERLGVYSVAIQEGGMERLLKTGYTEKEIKNIVLTPQEFEVYKHWAKWAEEIRPRIADLARELYNIELGEVENYFPFMTDFKAMSEVEIWKRFGEGVEEIGMPTKNVEVGFLKERVALGKVKIDFMEVANKHMDNVSYFLTMAKDIRMLFEIANNSKFGEKVGDLGQRITLEWMDLLARKGGHAQGDRIALLDTLRKNVGAAVLGFRLSSVIIQPTALIDGASLVGAKWVFRGAQDFISDVRWRDLIRKLSEIKKRDGDDPAFLALSENKIIARVQEYGFKPLKFLDLIAAGSVATGAYQKYLFKNKIPVDFEKLHPEAAEYATKWMRRTQSSAFFKDAPLAISRGRLTGNRSFDKALFQFMSFLLNRWSVIRHDAWRAGIRVGRTTKGLHILFWLLIVAVITEMGVRRASNMLIEFITDKPKRDDGFAERYIRTILGNIPFVSNALSVSVYGGEPMPVLEAVKKPYEEVPKLWKEKEATKIRGLIGLAESVGTFMGIPGSSQFGQLGRGWVAGMEKEEKIELPKLPKPEIPKPPGI